MPYLHADKDKRFKRGAENTSGLCRVFRLLECRIKPVPFRECARDGNFFCRPGGFFQAGGATFLKELKGEHRTKEDLPSIEQTLTASSIHSDNGGGAALSAIVLLAFTPSMNACSTTAPAETGGAETSRITESASFGTLQIVIDWSGSCVQPALEEAWNGEARIAEHHRSEPHRCALHRVV